MSEQPAPLTLAANRAARRDAPYNAAQAAILSDAALERAGAVIASWPGFAPTPLHDLKGLAREAGVAALHYKDEAGRFGLGSFKALGGAYAVAELVMVQVAARTGARPSSGDAFAGAHRDVAATLTVCCATDGNHGRSVAWGAQRLGCPCVIFLHEGVSAGQQAAIERYGARIVRTKGHYDDSVREAAQTANAEGWTVVSDTSYPGYTEIPAMVMQGYEVMAREAFDALPAPPTHILLQTGVGGMAAAVAACAVRRWGARRPLIVLADPVDAACWVESFQTGAPTAAKGDLGTVMAGLACGEVSTLAWQILVDHADFAVAVPDDAALALMRRLAFPRAGDPAIVAGESATAGLAALFGAMAHPALRAALALGPASRVLVFGTEGDTDPVRYEQVVGHSAARVMQGDEARAQFRQRVMVR